MSLGAAEIRFYGVRGSIPTPLRPAAVRDKIAELLSLARPADLRGNKAIARFLKSHYPHGSGTVGGNSSCVEMRFPGAPVIVCDAGTGLREFGQTLIKDGQGPREILLFLSHTHWDHIMGFPFFLPAYIKGYRLRIFGCHPKLRDRFVYQQTATHFPVTLEQMAADMQFTELVPGQTVEPVAGLRVTPVQQDHPGDSFAYVFEQKGVKFIYSTDSSYHYFRDLPKRQNPLSGADVFIFDAMYSFLDYMDKLDWGHSSSFVGVDFAAREGIRHLVLFHHEPAYDDQALHEILEKTQRYAKKLYPESRMKVSLAVEGASVKARK